MNVLKNFNDGRRFKDEISTFFNKWCKNDSDKNEFPISEKVVL